MKNQCSSRTERGPPAGEIEAILYSHRICSNNCKKSRLNHSYHKEQRQLCLPLTSTLHLQEAIPASTHGCNGFEAARCKLVGTCVASVNGPIEEIYLVGIKFQEQDDNFTAELMNLKTWRKPVIYI